MGKPKYALAFKGVSDLFGSAWIKPECVIYTKYRFRRWVKAAHDELPLWLVSPSQYYQALWNNVKTSCSPTRWLVCKIKTKDIVEHGPFFAQQHMYNWESLHKELSDPFRITEPGLFAKAVLPLEEVTSFDGPASCVSWLEAKYKIEFITSY